MRLPIVSLLILSASTACSPKAEPAGDEVDRMVVEAMKAEKIPAASILVIKDGKILKQGVYGKARLDPPVAADARTVFPVFSITKTFTAVGVLKLVDAGKLGLDDTVGKLLPDRPAVWHSITVRQLLSHTSGLPDLLADSSDVMYVSEDREAALKIAAARPLAKPGESYAYIQTGYVLLGEIIERKTGKPFERYMAEDVFRPLGMTATTYGNRRSEVPGRALQYQTAKFEQVNGAWRTKKLDAPMLADLGDNPAYNNAGATLNTNADDLVKWEDALSSGKLLKPETLTAMWATSPASIRVSGYRTNGMGLGWVMMDDSGHKTAYHNGGSSALYLRFLDDHLTIVVMTNCHGAYSGA